MTAASDVDCYEDVLAALRVVRSAGVAAGRSAAVAEIEVALYTNWFTLSGQRLGPVPIAPEPPGLIAGLRCAHAATERFEPGWHVVAVGGQGEIVAERGQEQLVLMPPDYVNVSRLAAPVRVGEEVAVTLRRDFVDHENGWWMTDGHKGPAPSTPMVRLYWNCLSSGAPAVISELTRVLEDAGAQYSLKCPNDVALFERADALVLYFTPAVYDICKADLRQAHTRLDSSLDSPTPPFTLRLGRGVAAAEDPGNGQSYGQSRCAAVAALLVPALVGGVSDDCELVSIVLDGLASHGISGDHPFLSSDSPADLVTPW